MGKKTKKEKKAFQTYLRQKQQTKEKNKVVRDVLKRKFFTNYEYRWQRIRRLLKMNIILWKKG